MVPAGMDSPTPDYDPADPANQGVTLPGHLLDRAIVSHIVGDSGTTDRLLRERDAAIAAGLGGVGDVPTGNMPTPYDDAPPGMGDVSLGGGGPGFGDDVGRLGGDGLLPAAATTIATAAAAAPTPSATAAATAAAAGAGASGADGGATEPTVTTTAVANPFTGVSTDISVPAATDSPTSSSTTPTTSLMYDAASSLPEQLLGAAAVTGMASETLSTATDALLTATQALLNSDQGRGGGDRE